MNAAHDDPAVPAVRKAVVTGAAGFIGSHVSELLLRRGIEVVGIDCFTPYYDTARKRATVAEVAAHGGFTLVERDLSTDGLADVLDGVDVVYHLAGQPGVRASWDTGFGDYVSWNVHATQRLLEAAKRAQIGRVVYASSSSVYGNAETYPTVETDLPAPHSPYGVTKLAAEHLAVLYARNFGLSTVSLRYFTVFGPRQRPEMAMMQLIDTALDGRAFTLFGTGEQVRDFTYVRDIAEATVLCGLVDVAPGSVFNVAGGAPATMNEVIDLLGTILGAPVQVERVGAVAGDVDRTGGSTDLIRSAVGWKPAVTLADGLAEQVAWARASRAARA